jgi:hypothetical protein
MASPARDDATLGRRLLLLLVPLAILAGAYYWYHRSPPTAVPAPGTAAETVAPPAAATPAPEHPLPAGAAEEPALPPLGESDGLAAEALAGLFGEENFRSMFVPDDLVRRIAATVDNLPRDKVAVRLRPLSPIGTPFVASGEEGAPALSEENYGRYARYVGLLEALDARAAVRVYLRLYPLLQSAYAELGNPAGFFNDRVVRVIDDLLEAPELDGVVALERPSVAYRFADPSLESRSAGQKLLLRMGPDNARRIKAKLREIRALIATTQR